MYKGINVYIEKDLREFIEEKRSKIARDELPGIANTLSFFSNIQNAWLLGDINNLPKDLKLSNKKISNIDGKHGSLKEIFSSTTRIQIVHRLCIMNSIKTIVTLHHEGRKSVIEYISPIK